ncbi:MAG: CbiQ family ECF transporter T component [Ruthenibacterium lactatiformans]
MPELLDALRRARVPEVGDLAVLIYRYIFILFATFRSMRMPPPAAWLCRRCAACARRAGYTAAAGAQLPAGTGVL